MNPDDVRARVEEVAALAPRDERMHATEDDLWIDVLRAIAAGAEKPAELAVEALKTTELKFYRWYA